MLVRTTFVMDGSSLSTFSVGVFSTAGDDGFRVVEAFGLAGLSGTPVCDWARGLLCKDFFRLADVLTVLVPDFTDPGELTTDCLVPDFTDVGELTNECLVPDFSSFGELSSDCLVPGFTKLGEPTSDCLVPDFTDLGEPSSVPDAVRRDLAFGDCGASTTQPGNNSLPIISDSNSF